MTRLVIQSLVIVTTLSVTLAQKYAEVQMSHGVHYFYDRIDTETSEALLSELRNASMPPFEYRERSLLGCGMCLANLEIGASGVITSPGYPEDYPQDQTCYWLLHTHRDAEIRLTCTDIHLGPCVVREDENERLKSFNDVLFVSENWKITGSSAFCGDATDRYGTIMKISDCNRMLVIFKSDAIGHNRGFKCDYMVVKSYKK